MGNARERLDLQVLRIIEELLQAKGPDDPPVATAAVLRRMRQPAKAEAEVTQAMADLLARGNITGRELRGDNRVQDVTVFSITEQGFQRLRQ